jgi:hypothetical protein
MNKFCSIFSQLLQLFPRIEFENTVKQTQAERYTKGFTCWGQFVSMMFCQLGRAHSTLAYANEHRPWELYQKTFFHLLGRCQNQVSGKKKFKFKNKLVSLDSSIIDLCLALYDWAKFRRTKGAIKLHLILDHDGYLPSFAVLTEGKVSDVKVAHTLKFDPGTIVVYDRGYNDYLLFGKWTEQGIFFVTRMKDNALFEVWEEKPIPQNRNILKDQIVRLTGLKAEDRCPHLLRRIEFYDAEKDTVFVFLSNNFRLGSTTIAAIYKDRWQIELFFKALKQNLKIKTFVGTSANAVKIQIWTALIAILILRFLQLQSQFKWSLSNLVALLRMNLFTHRDLWAWLNKPFEIPPVPYEQQQYQLQWV